MKKILTLTLILSSVALVSLFQNCSKVSVRELDATNVNSLGNPDDDIFPDTGNTDIDNLFKSCADAKSRGALRSKKMNVVFEDPANTCDWNQSGNMSDKNGYIRARIEQYQSLSLPSDATVCDIQMSNINSQQFLYDDNIIMTVNNYIIASTSNFTRHLSQKNGYFLYDWSKLLDKDAQNDPVDTTIDKQYCAGGAGTTSVCQFPVTEKVGTIRLDFDKRVIQSILGLSDSSSVQLGFITTGDNDSSDCHHVPVHLDVQVEYY